MVISDSKRLNTKNTFLKLLKKNFGHSFVRNDWVSGLRLWSIYKAVAILNIAHRTLARIANSWENKSHIGTWCLYRHVMEPNKHSLPLPLMCCLSARRMVSPYYMKKCQILHARHILRLNTKFTTNKIDPLHVNKHQAQFLPLFKTDKTSRISLNPVQFIFISYLDNTKLRQLFIF